MADIHRDPRHNNVAVLLERDVPARQFPSWAMGFKRPAWEEAPATAFRITRAALDDRLEAIADADIAALVDSFVAINAHELGRTG